MKFGFNWPSGFRVEDIVDVRLTMYDDGGPCLYYKLTSEPKGSGELISQCIRSISSVSLLSK